MHTFSYGTKRVKYSNDNIYVEPVDSLHDLTFFEDRLSKNGIPWAVYVKVSKLDKERHETKFVLVAEDYRC